MKIVMSGRSHIGPHTCVQLVEADYNHVLLDNLSNSSWRWHSRVAATGFGNRWDAQ